jgi:hypothetical protein
MKRLSVILMFSLLTSLSVQAQVKSFRDILGKWDIVGTDMPGASLEVIDSTKIFLTYGGERKQVSDATLNTKKSPAWFDFRIADSTGTLQVKTLIHVYGDGIMKWQLFVEEERPEFFTSARGEMMYLKKVSEGSAVARSQ